MDCAHQRRSAYLWLSYSRLINGLEKAGVSIDRKILAELAVADTAAFGAIAQQAKTALGIN